MYNIECTKNKKINIQQIRLDILRMAFAAGKNEAHLGSSLSLVEILAVLYDNYSLVDLPYEHKKDTLIISKGHGIMAQYAILKQLGIIKDEELDSYKHDNTRLYAHPTINNDFGIDFSMGSLGQGLSIGSGVALAYHYKGEKNSKVFILLGDGECNEGAIWEAAMFITTHHLTNLVVIIDRNYFQYDDKTEDIISLEPFISKWESFGFQTRKIDGHNIDEIEKTISLQTNKPLVIIAETIKGKGISFMENTSVWHTGYLKQDLYEKAVSEITRGR